MILFAPVCAGCGGSRYSSFFLCRPDSEQCFMKMFATTSINAMHVKERLRCC